MSSPLCHLLPKGCQYLFLLMRQSLCRINSCVRTPNSAFQVSVSVVLRLRAASRSMNLLDSNIGSTLCLGPKNDQPAIAVTVAFWWRSSVRSAVGFPNSASAARSAANEFELRSWRVARIASNRIASHSSIKEFPKWCAAYSEVANSRRGFYPGAISGRRGVCRRQNAPSHFGTWPRPGGACGFASQRTVLAGTRCHSFRV